MRILKLLSTSVLLIMLSTLTVFSVWADAPAIERSDTPKFQEIRIPIGENYFIVNGVKQKTDTPAYLTDEGVTMIPLRAFLKLYSGEDYEIDWDSETKTVRVVFSYLSRTTFYTAGSNCCVHNEYKFAFEKGRSELVNDIFYLPARAFCNSFDFEISWDRETSTAIITKEIK